MLQKLEGVAAGPLIESSIDANALVRRVSVRVLATMKDKSPRVVQALRDAKDDPDAAVRYLALTGLRTAEETPSDAQ